MSYDVKEALSRYNKGVSLELKSNSLSEKTFSRLLSKKSVNEFKNSFERAVKLYNNNLEEFKKAETKQMIENIFKKIPNENNNKSIEIAILNEVREFQTNKKPQILQKLDELGTYKVDKKLQESLKDAKSQILKVKSLVKNVKSSLFEGGLATEKTICNIISNEKKATGMFGSLESFGIAISDILSATKIDDKLIKKFNNEVDNIMNSEKNFEKSYEKLKKLHDASSNSESNITESAISVLQREAEKEANDVGNDIFNTSKKLKSTINITKNAEEFFKSISSKIEKYSNPSEKLLFTIVLANNLTDVTLSFLETIDTKKDSTGSGGIFGMILGIVGGCIGGIIAGYLIGKLIGYMIACCQYGRENVKWRWFHAHKATVYLC